MSRLADELLDDLNSDGESDDNCDNKQRDTSPREFDDKDLFVETKIKCFNATDTDITTSQKALTKHNYGELVNEIGSLNFASPNHKVSEENLLHKAKIYAQPLKNTIKHLIMCVKRNYQLRFPELDSIVTNTIEYTRVVKVLGNDLKTIRNGALQFLSSALIMIISVAAATTRGQLLSDEKMAGTLETCDDVITLDSYRLKIFAFIESRITQYFPNSIAIVGAKVMAEIVSSAEGVFQLEHINKSQLLQLGSTSETSSGTNMDKGGHIFNSELVQRASPNHQNKIADLVADKFLLALRVDLKGESIDGQIGRNFCVDIESKINKLQGISYANLKKQSSTVIDCHLRKHNLKKIHEMKKRANIIETRKHQNRMSFNDMEDETLSQTKITKNALIDEATRKRIKNVLMKNLGIKNSHEVSSTSMIKSTSDANCTGFTPLQRLQINNPSAVEKMIGDANGRYFSDTSGFMSLKNK